MCEIVQICVTECVCVCVFVFCLVVRSHECVRNGFITPFKGAQSHLLCTIFSASNYSNSGNRGAYMRFSYFEREGAVCVVDSPAVSASGRRALWFSIHPFNTSEV